MAGPSRKHARDRVLRRRRLCGAIWVVLVAGLPTACRATLDRQTPARLVVLTEAGRSVDQLPVLAMHPAHDSLAAEINQGFLPTMLRLCQAAQNLCQTTGGPEPEPAYLLLSRNQGGFPRYGFVLNGEAKPEVAFVDLHERSALRGRFGAIDQILPHELGHIVLHLLAGPRPPGGSNQIHAIGVRTDPGYALDEGFAEHFQLMAIEDPDAAPATRALTSAEHRYLRARQNLNAYARELRARWAPLAPLRMTFPLWFSQTEQVQRYFGVRENVFARESRLPPRLLAGSDPYAAYLLENTLPGDSGASPKPVGRLIATEGVVCALFYRWMSDAQLRESYRDEAFYRRFGREREGVSPRENAYLKLFHVLHHYRPRDILETLHGYRDAFRDEAGRLEEITAEIFLGQAPQAPHQIWLANPDFTTGTSLFDQFRGLPRVHTFDLNAASLVDLVSVRGVDAALARRLMTAAPYATLDDLGMVPGVTAELRERFHTMSGAMSRLRSTATQREQTLTLRGLLLPTIRRLLIWLLVAVGIGSCCYRFVSRASWGHAILGGVAATLLGLLGGWMLHGLFGAASLLVIAIVLALPAGLRCWRRGGRGAQLARRSLAPLAAGIPIAVLVTPWF